MILITREAVLIRDTRVVDMTIAWNMIPDLTIAVSQPQNSKTPVFRCTNRACIWQAFCATGVRWRLNWLVASHQYFISAMQ